MFPVDHEGLLFHKHQKKHQQPSKNHQTTMKTPSKTHQQAMFEWISLP